MKNNVSLLIILVLSALSFCKAQGIDGHRLIVGGRFDYFMLFGVRADHVYNAGYQGSLGFVTSKRTQLNVGLNSYRISYSDDVLDTIYFEKIGDATDVITCREVELTTKFYLKGLRKRKYDCIAPDGKYFEFGVAVNKTTYTPGDLSGFAKPELITPELTAARLIAGVGNQQVWWNRMVVNTGVLISCPIYEHHEDVSISTDPEYSRWQKSRNLIRAYVGIGYLF